MTLTQILHQVADRVRLAARVTGLTGGTFAVDAVVITNGGSGYTSAPAVAFPGGTGAGAAATATVAGGVVTRITMTNNGTGYTNPQSVTFTGGAGSGAAGTAQLLALTLDAIPTLGISVAVLPAPFVQFLLNGHVHTYRLRVGTDAELSPYIIRPDDYAASTNEKVWELIGFNPIKVTQPIKGLTYAGTVNLDLAGPDYLDLGLTGNVIFTTSNRVAGRRMVIRISADASLRTFTFPAWVFVGGAPPASIAASKRAILNLTAYGTADTDIVAQYSVEP